MSVEVERPPAQARLTGDGVFRLLRDTGADPAARPNVIHRVLVVFTAFSMFSTLMGVFGPTVRWPGIGLLLGVSMVAVVAVAVMGFTAKTMRWLGYAELALALVAVVGLVLWMVAMIITIPGYRSDEEIFVQYSADLLRHGHNPYSADLTPAYAHYPSPFPTKLLDGSFTHHLDYPALPTLLTTVLTVMVGTFHTVGLLCTLFLVATVFVMYFLLPRGLRSLGALLVGGVPVLATGALAGLMFALVVPFLAFAAYRWKHTGEGGRLSRMDVAKAVAVGCAVATTQVAWFPIPFLFLGIFLARRGELGRRAAAIVTGKYIAVAAATFLVINVPFIVWNPGGWLRGAFAPLTQHAVPEGEGLINVVQSLSTGSGNLSLYTYSGALVMLGLLVAYWRHFDRLGSACFALPMIGLLFPTRSYWTYFIAYAAAWIVGLFTNEPDPEPEPVAARAEAAEAPESSEGSEDSGADTGAEAAETGPVGPKHVPLTPRVPWLSRYAAITVAAFLPAAAVFGAAVASPAPMTLKVDSYLTSAQLNSVQTVTITATNHSGHALSPHFMAIHGNGLVSGTWNIISGPKTIAAHSAAKYVVTAPSVDAMPPLTDSLKLQAVTDDPPTVSYTNSTKVQPYSTVLVADSPDLPLLPPGSSIVLTARVESQFGVGLHQAGIKLCLDQTKFTSGSTDFPNATVTADPAGTDPSCGVTDAQGEVRFTATSHGTQSHQLYFQSFAVDTSNDRFGYSTFLSAAWR